MVIIEKRILEFVNLCQASLDDIEGMGESPRLVSAEPLQGASTCCCRVGAGVPDAPMQPPVVRYTQGQGYTSHFDNRAGSQAVRRPGRVCLTSCSCDLTCVFLSCAPRRVPPQRKATFMVYLNDVEAGGQTFFPRARVWAPDVASGEEQLCTGVKISPKKGRCIFFLNIRHGKEDECSLHEAMPVASGDKWITTLWLGHEEHAAATPGC